jgi:hypothetical protein
MTPLAATRPCSRRRALQSALCLALIAAALWPVAARADFSSATLLSGDQELQLQFNEATAPALAAEGEYAVFQGALADVPGVYRRNLRSGKVQLVAGGDAADPENACNTALHPPAACDAAAPSVSREGRYVAFTTTADLEPASAAGEAGEPEGDRGCPEVYVRDMDLEPGTPGAYTLASALNGSDAGIVYLGGCPAAKISSFGIAGAQATPGVALGEQEGQVKVVFTVLNYSNLDASPGCVAPGVPPQYSECTPPSQVAVRDLQTETTTLVSATPAGAPTPHGGAFPSTDSEGHIRNESVGPEDLTAFSYGDQLTASSAAISADASTVAWLGTNIPAQVPSSAAKLEAGTAGDFFNGRELLGSEAEPLWRRIADGPGAVTRRLLAGSGLDFFYRAADEGIEPVLSGSFVGLHQTVFLAPALSENGSRVALLASAPRPTLEASFPQSGLPELHTDAYVVEVEDDPAIPPHVTALTEIADYAASPAAVEDVKDVAISPDGTRVAFDTRRTQLQAPALALISPPISYTQTSETYEANIALGTLQRVTSTYNGSEPSGGAGLLSFSGDGQTLAFESDATNLFFGDAVPASETYLARELAAEASVTPQEIGPLPPAQLPSTPWDLSATATAQADGSVLLEAQVPGAGRLTVSAGAQLPAPAPAKSASRRDARRHGATRASVATKKRAGKKSKQKRTSGGTAIPTRTVAQGASTATAATELRVRLDVIPAYESLVAGRDGLYAVLRVSFAAAHHQTLVEEIPVTFRRLPRAVPARRRGRTVNGKTKHGARGEPGAAR